jgi:predicted membrane protein (TIGR00267 family)
VNSLTDRFRLLLRISGTQAIVRRYAVVNGFDGALTMLGMLLGFYLSEDIPLLTMLNACLGVSVALAVSGVSSAYISESAEQQKALDKLRGAMVSDMEDSAHSRAAMLAPVVVALANGASPLVMGLLIMFPLWLNHLGMEIWPGAIEAAILTAVSLIFLLGMFLGRVRGTSLLISGLLTLLIAAITAGLIFLLGTQ